MRKRDPEAILEFFRGIRGCLVIVEGKRDAKALNTLGITDILAINGRPLIEIVHAVVRMREKPFESARDSWSGKGQGALGRGPRAAGEKGISDIIILTDFDQEGRRLAGKLSRLLRTHKVHPNQRLRSCVMKFGYNKIEDIKKESVLRIGRDPRKRKHSD